MHVLKLQNKFGIKRVNIIINIRIHLKLIFSNQRNHHDSKEKFNLGLVKLVTYNQIMFPKLFLFLAHFLIFN